MKIYYGPSALSDFRKAKLINDLKSLKVSNVSAEFIHFVDDSGISEEDEKVLKGLLDYGEPFTGKRNVSLILVVPRIGTLSPWSSKATDIAKNAGLTNVNRIERGIAYYISSKDAKFNKQAVISLVHDRMTETVLESLDEAEQLFIEHKAKPYSVIDIKKGKKASLVKANKRLGLALADDEIDYLFKAYSELDRNPTDVELMMFAQVNSEHCRHKIFNAEWIIDGKKQPKGLFKMIKNTYEHSHDGVLSAYSDNAAVLSNKSAGMFYPDHKSHVYSYENQPIHSVIKVETHNHPTAIAPFAGAATGTGGEIRDEAATGRGAKSKMGLSGYTVSNLNIPGSERPWEDNYGKPGRIVSALDIMLEAPIGAAAFANEFGRPNLVGYFRTFEQESEGERWGYHKPIMIAGGLGNIRDVHVKKNSLKPGSKVIVLGGPAMLIGLGGGAASSMQTGASSEYLDFASVQRANAEMERRAQEVINTCLSFGDKNPIITIHDVGAGGLSNALPELVHDSDLGAVFELRNVLSAEAGLSPLEIWCNEAQERYVLGIDENDLQVFKDICERECCPFSVVGETTRARQLIVNDSLLNNQPVNLPMSTLFGKPPRMTRTFTSSNRKLEDIKLEDIQLEEAINRVLRLPAVGSKKFLITIGDRNVGGLVTRDQMIGPWQVPVSDVAVTASSFKADFGEAMSMGERTPLALINSAASARMAIGEAITNILASDIDKLSDIKLSANWMAAAGYSNQDQSLFEAVKAIGEDFCPKLKLTIPVGKDSLSMRTAWDNKSVTSPLSLIISAFSPVSNVNKTFTPEINTQIDSSLILIDLGSQRLGGSALAQVYNQVGSQAPDVDPDLLNKFFKAIKDLKIANKLLAYHDRSDGGLITTLLEMAFSSRCGLDIDISGLPGNTLEKLFNEELGAVIQVKQTDLEYVLSILNKFLADRAFVLAQPNLKQTISIKDKNKPHFKSSIANLESIWSETSYMMQKIRDNSTCAEEEFASINDVKDPGLSPKVTFKSFNCKYKGNPRVAILREQGVNGQVEMAAAFTKAGFEAVDVHLNDIISGQTSLDKFKGLVACGGFSYGDVLGAGEGWAKTILYDEKTRNNFSKFFERSDTFSLGVCNGCQMLSTLKELIPGADNWPKFLKNKSEQFEARLVLTKINKSASIFFKDMEGSILPIPVAHGEGRAVFSSDKQAKEALSNKLVPLQYVDNKHNLTEKYPSNPNGSSLGITALTSPDGRATIMMPHPERAFMTRQLSWHPKDWSEDSPWLRMFLNARDWVS